LKTTGTLLIQKLMLVTSNIVRLSFYTHSAAREREK